MSGEPASGIGARSWAETLVFFVVLVVGCAPLPSWRAPAEALLPPLSVPVLLDTGDLRGPEIALAYRSIALVQQALDSSLGPGDRRVRFVGVEVAPGERRRDAVDRAMAVGDVPLIVVPAGAASAAFSEARTSEPLLIVPDGRQWSGGDGACLVGPGPGRWAQDLAQRLVGKHWVVDSASASALAAAARALAPAPSQGAPDVVLLDGSTVLVRELAWPAPTRLWTLGGAGRDLPPHLAERTHAVAVPFVPRSDPGLPHGSGVSEDRWAEAALLYDACVVAGAIVRRWNAGDEGVGAVARILTELGEVELSSGTWSAADCVEGLAVPTGGPQP